MTFWKIYRFFIFALLFGLGLSVRANEVSSSHQGDQRVRPTVEHPTEVDLKMYLEVLEARENVLEKTNEALLREADFSYVKIPLFMTKAAIDGYSSGRLLGLGGAATGAAGTATQVISQPALHWATAGGLDRMKSLGFNVGVIGISGVNNSLLVPGYRWQYSVPILGTAYTAYLWSDQLMHSAELIDKNGREILKIRKEKYRIRNLLDKS